MPRLDKQVKRTLEKKQQSIPEISEYTIRDAFTPYEVGAPDELALDLNTALRLAKKHSRSLQSKRDTLYQRGLSLLRERRSFGLQYESTLDYVLGLSGDNQSDTASASLTTQRKLPTGAEVSFSANSDQRDSGGTGTNSTLNTAYNTSLGLRVTQPLLLGAGYEASHETLVQAERDLVYALRDFALERQDFTIGIIQSFYQLLIQRTVLENTRLNVAQSAYLRERSEAFFNARKTAAIDVLRAQQQELLSQNTLNIAEANFDVAQKRFIIELGLPVDTPFKIVGDIPAVVSIVHAENDCIRAAQQFRLDLMTTRDRHDDAKRHRKLAKRGLLPQLNVYADVGWAGASQDRYGDQELEEESSAGVTLTLPLDKRDQRDALKSADIALRASERQLAEKIDTVKIEIIENFRRLYALATTVDINRKNIEISQSRVDNSVYRFKNGELSNRDVVEAENELLDARNAFSQAQVDYEIQRIRLLRNMGMLDVSEEGLQIERTLSDFFDTTEKEKEKETKDD